MTLNRAPRFSGISAGIALYLRPQVLIVALLGFSAGLPLALSGATLAVWMADRGADVQTIGLLSLAGLPYTLKFIWAPLVDALDVPVLSARLGRRRGWLIASQILLMAAILYLGTRDPTAAPLAIGLGAVLVAAASATQDIVIDAFRIESLKSEEQAAGMASYVATYRVGMLVSGAGAIGLAALLEAQGVAREAVWPIAYAAAAVLVLIGIVAVLVAQEPDAKNVRLVEQAGTAGTLQRIFETARSAFSEFLLRDAAVAVLVFVVLYKLCDALAGVMTAPFILSLGYDKGIYAGIVKGVGLIATLAGGFAGGALAGAMTLGKALWLGGLLQMASNLVFVWLGSVAPSVPALTAAIVVENVTGGIATVIFVAYISALCGAKAHTATQYALLTALVAVGRTVLASTSGYGVAALGWPLFFLATVAAALPGLALLAWLQRRGHFASLDPRE
ncbi:MAG: MFS transporter [Hyphomicrobiaceae bacterium]|jgi:MFS transporter, PAT family, beta-lactamase induction signal transducer AmpG